MIILIKAMLKYLIGEDKYYRYLKLWMIVTLEIIKNMIG